MSVEINPQLPGTLVPAIEVKVGQTIAMPFTGYTMTVGQITSPKEGVLTLTSKGGRSAIQFQESGMVRVVPAGTRSS